MATAIHVNGPCTLSYGAGGTAGGLTEIGVTEDGIDVEIVPFVDPIMADSGGPHVPVEHQDFGKIAYIRGRLTIYDSAVLEALQAMNAADGLEEPVPGKLIGANSKYFRLVLSSPIAANPYRFFYCTWNGPLAFKLGTRYTQPMVQFIAVPGILTGSMATKELYDHTAA